MKQQEAGKQLHNEALFNFHSSPVIMMTVTSGKVRLARHVARSGKETTAYRDLVGKPERDY
jgi:predicted phosphoribosyltransferase